MTNEEKQFLKRMDLSARLPYRVMVSLDGFGDGVLTGIEGVRVNTNRGINYPIHLCKPYLRPMESMTEEDIEEYAILKFENDDTYEILEIKKTGKGFVKVICGLRRDKNSHPCCFQCNKRTPLENWKGIDWLLKRHFDFRGLIKLGLALEAPEGMYKIK